MIKIYKLYDPRDVTETPFYVGFTTSSLEKRLEGHYKDLYLGKNTHKINKLKSLLKLSLKANIKLIKTFTDTKTAFQFEIKAIGYYKKKGIPLANSTIGGEGWTKYKVKVYNLAEELIETLTSCQEAADKYQCAEGTVSKICNGKSLHLRNQFVFRKENEEFNQYRVARNYRGKWSEKQKKKRAVDLKGKESNRKRFRDIEQYDLNGNLLKTWEDSKQIVDFYKLKNFSPVLRVIHGKRKKFKNYIWQLS